MNRRIWKGIAFGFSCCLAVFGQGVPYSGTTLQLSANNTQASQVPANSSSTLLAFTVEGDTSGGNSFDVVTTNPGVVVSLILPSGVEVTNANAASLGFTFTFISNGTLSEIEIPSVLSLPGTHTVVQIPGGQPSGVYQIRANAASVGTTSGVLATYFSSSTVGVTVTTDAANYSIGGTVVLSGLVFDGATPMTGTTVTATVSAPVSLASQATVGNVQLVGSQVVSSNLTDYFYSATLTNTGAAAQSVTAQAQTASLPSGITVLNDTLVFGNVAANASVTSLNSITIEQNPNQSFDPTTLQWNVTTPGMPATVTLADSGTGFDAASGDGIYTGTFTPTSAGTYTALLSFAGTSLAGNNFSRTAATQFVVTQPLANFVSFADAQQSGAVTVTANVNVQTAGTYQLTMQLQASNQSTIQGGTSVNLSTGSQQIAVNFSNSQLFQLGVNGPYERINALLVYVGSSGDLIADSRPDAGPTNAYTLVSVSPPLYFTGQNSAVGIGTSGGTPYNILRVQAGVFLGFPNITQSSCSWDGTLSDSSGNEITTAVGSGQLANGNQTVNLDFDGNRIGQTGAVGPYVVQAEINCNFVDATSNPLIQVSGFTANQFTNLAPDFTLSALVSSVTPGNTAQVPLQLTGIGSFNGIVNFSVLPMSNGFTASVGLPVLVGPGLNYVSVTAPTNATPGSVASVVITYATSTTSKTLSIPITVVSNQLTILINPSNPIVTAGGTQQLTAVVGNTSNQSVTWGLSAPLGTIDTNGLYTAPTSISSQQTVTVTATSAIEARLTGSTTIYLTPLGGPWLDQDIGTVGTAGNASIVNGVFTVEGSGNSLGDNNLTNIGFNYVYQSADGNLGIVARIVSASGAAGVMMRNSTSVYATYAFVSINQSGSATFCYLGNSGLQCDTPSTVSFPYWVQLTREGDGIAGAISPDGVTWTPIGDANLSMGTAVDIGLAATSLSSSTLGSATIDNVSAGSVAVSPLSVHLFANQTQQFLATSPVNWSISPSMGTVSNSGLYTAPSSVTTSQLVEVTATTLNNLARESASVFLNASTGPPVFTPPAGTYGGPQSVTISSATPGASINYTLDGSTPSETAGTLYAGAITVSATTTINAIAWSTGSADSPVVSATYTITNSGVATPTFSPAAGTYTSAQTVTISTATSGASIRYTTDGSTPSETAGTLYSGPITVSVTATLKAIAYASGMPDSAVASANYTISTSSSNAAQFVKTDSTTEGSWKGVYGGDGYNVIDDTAAYPSYVTVTPSGQSNYIWNSSTSDAWALQKAFSNTDRIEATWYTGGSFTIDMNFTDGGTHQLAVYCLDESGGSRTETLSVLDGVTSAVLDSRNVSNFVTGQYLVWNLSGHVVLNITNTGSPNAVISGLFFDVPGAVAPPYFDPPARVWSTAQSVSLTTMAGASIRYTTDGSTPSEAAGTLYSGPIAVNSTTTIKATAYITGLNDSAVASGTYTISPLPSPWTDQDIGSVGVAGSGAFDPTTATFTVQGSGTDAFNAPDQFNYLYQSLSGDGVIIARAATEQNTYQTTKAGVMIRESTDPSAAFAFVSLAPDSGGVFFSTRADGAGPNYNGPFSASAPVWVKLVRQSNTFTGYYSSDGNTWTAAGSPFTVSMAANVLVGLAVVSANNTALTTAVFDNLSIGSGISVSVSPTTATLSANQTQQFAATLTGNSNTTVTWSISPNVGAISSAGLYTAPSSISSQQTVTVAATSVADTTKSATAAITLTPPTVAAPVFSPVGGVYSSAQTVTISTTTSGASIRYTTDGSTPSETAGTLYSGPITVSATTTINAIAYESGMIDSGVSSATYTIAGLTWYNTAWSNRKAITINGSQVSGSSNLVNFPVLVSVTDANLMSVANGGNVGSANGNDILFTASDGATKLSHEIETYNPSTGQLIAWVSVPTLSPGLNTVIYIYYGNVAAANQQNPTGVWDSYYEGVWHLPNGSTLSGNDSTSNTNNAVSLNGTSAGTGEIDGAASFNGTSNYIDVSNSSSLNGWSQQTISLWMNGQSDQGNDARLIEKGANDEWTVIFDGQALALQNLGSNSVAITTNVAVADTTWHKIDVTMDNNSKAVAIYVDGVLNVSGTSASSATSTNNNIYMGQYGGGGYYYHGLLDEVRVSNMVRSAAWIATEYNNESSPSTFLSEGTQQNSGAVATPAFSPAGGTYTSAQTVTISTTTTGASIHYTTDGSTPSETAGTLYSGPITVSATTTINAIAYESGLIDSSIASATYTIEGMAATPTFSPAAGTYSSAQTVTISTATSGASIRYTTDGSTPSETAGILYGGPITVSATTTIKAIAYESGMIDSSIASAVYTISGSNSAQFVKTDSTTEGSWKGVYGGDGYNVIDDTAAYPSYVAVTPSGQSNYIWNSSTSDAWALEKAFSNTDRIEATWYTGGSFTIDLNFTNGGTHQLAVYCVDESGGSRTETLSVLDGVTSAVLDSRNVSSFVTGQYVVWNLSGHVVLNITNTGSPNAVISGLFFDVPGAVAPPWFDPPARVWSTAQSVSLTTMAGASIRYTTDSSTPSETAGTLYSGPIAVDSTTTIKAMAYITGLNDSAVVSGTYTISPLPSPWTDQDIGAVGVAGSGAFDPTSATFTIQGSGSEVYYAPDQFNYLSQPLSGDGVIIARVVTVQNIYQTSKAGVMIRETADPSAAFAYVSLAPDSGGVFFSTRADSAGPNYNGPFSSSAPVWVKLVRQGNTFTGYYSSDGNTWTAAGSPYTVSMAANVLVGLAVVSTNNTALTTAVFDNVSIAATIAVSVSPPTASLSANQTQQFTATVTNTSNTAVTWSISPNVGTISSGGLYTAPSSIGSQQTVTVTATSVADTTKSGTATITLTSQ